MGFVYFNEKGWLVGNDGKPMYIIGINYVASYVCTNFFEDWRPEVLENDLANISKLGFNAVRIPVFWGFAEPEEGKFNPLVFERMEIFLGWAKKYNLYVLPWFLVGIATVQKDVPYRMGRPYFEGGMLFAAENHLRTFARRFKNNEQILFWDICDEPEFYELLPGAEKIPYDAPRYKHWLTHMYEAFKKEDPNHLVTMGYGHIATENFGYNLRDTADVLDLMTVTCYPYESSVEGLDTMRNNYFVGFNVKMNSLSGKYVFTLEAPGFSNVAFSEEMIGRYFNVSIYSNLLCGSKGVMPWCYNDFSPDIWEGAELNHQSLEPYFGIITNEGRLKPSGKALAAFGEFIRKAGITDYTIEQPRIGVFIPDGYYYDVYPAQRKLRAAMQFTKGCGADMDFIWEDRSYDPYDLIVLAAVTGNQSGYMHMDTWHRLRDYVNNGGTLVHSYDSILGLSPYHRELFGAEVLTRHKDFGFDEITFARDFGSWKAGEKVKVPSQGHTEFLKVRPDGGELIASFTDGSPAIIKNKLGKGTAWLMTGQFHNGTFEIPYKEYLSHPFFDLYDAIFEETGLYRPVRYIQPELEAGLLHKNGTEKLLIFVNHGLEDITAKIRLDKKIDAGTLRDFDTGSNYSVIDNVFELFIKAAEAKVIKI